jgi:hypothetical protein
MNAWWIEGEIVLENCVIRNNFEVIRKTILLK